MTPSWKDTYGYPVYYPWAFLLLILGGIGSVIAAFYTMNIRWFLVTALVALVVLPAKAHDSGQWEASDPAIKEWYRALMQPDNPHTSCCGESDAYWCDTISVRGKKTFCTITDDRDDAPLRRPHVDLGTEIEIPNHKLKWDRGNPTGHGVVFLSKGGFVFCFVQPGGA